MTLRCVPNGVYHVGSDDSGDDGRVELSPEEVRRELVRLVVRRRLEEHADISEELARE